MVAPRATARISLDTHMIIWEYTCRGIYVLCHRRAAPARHLEHALLLRAIGGRADAPSSPAATVGLKAPQGVARGWLRRVAGGGPAAGLSPQSQAAPGGRRVACAVPPLLVEARRCPGATPGAYGEGPVGE